MLTDTHVRQAKAKEKPYKLYDRDGLYVIVNPTGSRLWRFNYRFNYRFNGKAKTLSMGKYPDVSLSQARERVRSARQEVADHRDPSESRKRAKAKAQDDFESIAREWLHIKFADWSPGYAKHVVRRLENWVLPWIGSRPISELVPQDVLGVVRRIERAGKLDTAHRVLQYVSNIFSYAMVTGRAVHDIAGPLVSALPVHRQKHRAAILEPDQLGQLLRAIDGYEGSLVVRSALKLLPYLFVRPGELRGMRWSELSLPDGRWNICAARMKSDRPHVVPLATQVVAILEELEPLTGCHELVFPSQRSRSRPMSDNTLNAALRRLGYTQEQVTAHGFRATARTLLDEELEFRVDFIEHQLAHAVKDPLGRAYNRTRFLDERAEMMQIWADYLDNLAGCVPRQ